MLFRLLWSQWFATRPSGQTPRSTGVHRGSAARLQADDAGGGQRAPSLGTVEPVDRGVRGLECLKAYIVI